jgi:hypothetical protein
MEMFAFDMEKLFNQITEENFKKLKWIYHEVHTL